MNDGRKCSGECCAVEEQGHDREQHFIVIAKQQVRLSDAICF